MKNLFFALAFLFIGSISFADNKNNNPENISTQISSLCYYEVTVERTIGTMTYTQTVTYLGPSLGEWDCELQAKITMWELENRAGL